MDDLVAFLRARLDEIDPDDYHDRTECDLGKLQFFGDCSCQVPAVVRHDIAAKRRILDEHPILTAERVCTRCSDYAEPGEVYRAVPGPCATVRLLALAYADHDDFREEWKP